MQLRKMVWKEHPTISLPILEIMYDDDPLPF